MEHKLITDSLINKGYAIINLEPFLLQIEELFRDASYFFNRSEDYKTKFANPESLDGYRAMGQEYSESSDRPDLNESFSLWVIEDANKEWAKDCDLYKHLFLIKNHYLSLTTAILNSLRDYYNVSSPDILIQEMSYLQVNFYNHFDDKREYLQDAHEDGHLVTIVQADSKGLEIEINGIYKPIALNQNEALVMPGSILTLMTGGEIKPLYHRVRNYKQEKSRTSLMFFVNPAINKEITPWVTNSFNEDVDILSTVLKKSEAFGLKPINKTRL